MTKSHDATRGLTRRRAVCSRGPVWESTGGTGPRYDTDLMTSAPRTPVEDVLEPATETDFIAAGGWFGGHVAQRSDVLEAERRRHVVTDFFGLGPGGLKALKAQGDSNDGVVRSEDTSTCLDLRRPARAAGGTTAGR